jgi:peptidoglycan hydrolase-like protein with peptidoglycan-binding domain
MPSSSSRGIAIVFFVVALLIFASAYAATPTSAEVINPFAVSLPTISSPILPGTSPSISQSPISPTATSTSATTTATFDLFQTLETEITSLESELATLRAVTSTSQPPSAVHFSRPLAPGSTGSDVTALQTLLAKEGFFNGPVTGYFGPLTEAAVAAFQTHNGLEPVGSVGPKTCALLNSLLGPSNTPSGASAPIPASSSSVVKTSAQTDIPLSLPAIALTFGTGGEGGGGGASSNNIIASTPDTTPPFVSFTAPSSGATVSGSSLTLTATASDNVAVANVQFKVDGSNISSAITSSPYTITWNSTGVSDGSHTLYAVAKDTSGNFATSSISISVRNNPPVISSIATSSPSGTTETITWTTDEPATSDINYGTSISYSSASSSAALVTSHSITLTGLTAATTYHFQVETVDGQSNTATSTDQTFTASTAYPSSAAFLYSLRKVNSNYNGYAIQIRRSSDGATQNIGFIGQDLDVASIRAFVGTATTTYVVEWYDQSGNGNNASQSTQADQPELVLGAFNGHAAVYFPSGSVDFLNANYSSSFALTGDQTIGAVYETTNTGQVVLVGDYDNSSFVGWSLGTSNSGGHIAYYSKTKNAYSNGTSVIDDGIQRVSIATRSSGAVQFYTNGATDGSATGHGNSASSAPLSIGAASNGNNYMTGMVSEIFGYGSVLGSATLSNIAADTASYWGVTTPVATPNAFAGSSGVEFPSGQYISAGNVLQYEKTQPWSMLTSIYMNGRPSGGGVPAALVFGDTHGTPYMGYEVWIDEVGFIRVRILNSYTGSNYLGVLGSIDVADSKWHRIGVTYDGSGTAAGVKMYVDGVLDSEATIEKDALTGSSVSTGAFEIGNQYGFETAYYMRGALDEFQLCNTSRSASYMEQNTTGSALPSVDANVVLDYPFNEGSGTSTADLSTNNYTGTLSSSSMWLPAAQ